MWLLYCCVINYTEPLQLSHTLLYRHDRLRLFLWSACVYYTTLAQSLCCDWEWERDYRMERAKMVWRRKKAQQRMLKNKKRKKYKKEIKREFFPCLGFVLSPHLLHKKAEHISEIVSVSEWVREKLLFCSTAGLIQCFARILGWSMCVAGLAKISLRKKVSVAHKFTYES